MIGEPLVLQAQFCNEPLQNWFQENHDFIHVAYTRIAYSSRWQIVPYGVLAL